MQKYMYTWINTIDDINAEKRTQETQQDWQTNAVAAIYFINLSEQQMWELWIYSVSQKIPPEDLWQFFQNGWEFSNQILLAYYAFLSTLDYKFLFNYLQLWRSYAILSATTQFTSCAQNVHQRPKRTLAFSDIFPKQLGIFRPNFTRLLNVHMYARVQICIQLSPTLTKLCHINPQQHTSEELQISTPGCSLAVIHMLSSKCKKMKFFTKFTSYIHTVIL